MMLWAGWGRTCPAPRGSPHRLLQHLLGRSLPRRCCSCTVHNPCTRAAAWPTGSWHVSLFSFTRTFILVLQALLPGWTLARPQVSLLLPLHLHHKIRCRLSLLKACITTTSAARNQWFDWHKLCSDATNSQQQPMIATKANDLSKPLLVWPTQQCYWSKTGSSHPTKPPQSVTNPTSHVMYKRLSVFISQMSSCPNSNKPNQTCTSQPRPVNGPSKSPWIYWIV